MEYLIIYAVFCLLVGWLSDSTKLGFGSGFLISVLLTPIVGFIIYLLYPAKEPPSPIIQQHFTPQPQQPSKDKIEDIHDRLEKLEAMKVKNLITESEYQSLRKEILGSK